jgi:hypothetical protein
VTPPATPGRDNVVSKSLTVASPGIGTPTLTVGEIAEQLSANSHRLATLLDQGLVSGPPSTAGMGAR